MPNSYGLREEIVNSITHGLGVFLGVVALTYLSVKASNHGTTPQLLSYIVFSISVILLYTASTLYHAIPHARAKKILKICDHSSIYILIAGTYTPFLVFNLKGKLGENLLILIWALAFTGIIFKFFFTGRFRVVSTLLYLGMGWIIAFALGPLKQAVSPAVIELIFAGGICYTFGTVFYLATRIPFHHAIWHLFVLAGTLCHFIAISLAGNFP